MESFKPYLKTIAFVLVVLFVPGGVLLLLRKPLEEKIRKILKKEVVDKKDKI